MPRIHEWTGPPASERRTEAQRKPVAIRQANVSSAAHHRLANSSDVGVLTLAAVTDVSEGDVIALIESALDAHLVAVLAFTAATVGRVAGQAIVEAHRCGNVPPREHAKPLRRQVERHADIVTGRTAPLLVLTGGATVIPLALEQLLVLGDFLHMAEGQFGDKAARVEVVGAWEQPQCVDHHVHGVAARALVIHGAEVFRYQ